MISMIQRGPTPGAAGLLCKEHSHSAWVTNDLERAMDVFRTRYGVREFSFIEGDVPGTGSIKVAFAWAGGQVLELIFATGPGYAFYNEILPENEFAIRFHHLGFIIHDEDGWRQLEREIAEGRWEVVYSTLTGDFIDAYYLRAPELGHFIEYVRPFEAGNTFYNQVPQS